MTVARVILGAGYVAGGLVPFTHWADLPIPSPEGGQFVVALVDSNILVVSKLMEVIFGIALLLNRWVPLSLAMLAPVLFFIAWLDWYVDPFPEGVAAVAVLVTCHIYLVFRYWQYFRPLMVRRAVP